jgi:aryl-alcohol dehydrogenase-like predicted oxidoreductase
MALELGIGTHLIKSGVEKALSIGFSLGFSTIDTAPNYQNGLAHKLVAKALKLRETGVSSNDGVAVFSKVGFIPRKQLDHIAHLISKEYIRYQALRNLAELEITRLSALFLHNPEIQLKRFGRNDFVANLAACFEECERLCQDKKIESYGIATWNGLLEEVPVRELVSLAKSVAGEKHRFRRLQLPISLVRHEHVHTALKAGCGPLIEASENGLKVIASAPLHCGELTSMVSSELCSLFGPHVTAAQACVWFAASAHCVDIVLIGCSSLEHLREFAAMRDWPKLGTEQLTAILDLINSEYDE